MNHAPKIFFCGDNHGHFDHIIEAVQKHAPDAIILLGDIQAQRPLEVELAPILGKTVIRFIHGNHDTDSAWDYSHLFESQLAYCNLHGRVENIAGVRVAGLGGIFRGKIWSPPAEPIFKSYDDWHRAIKRSRPSRLQDSFSIIAASQERQHRSTIFPDVFDRLGAEKADVLVTHEAPSCHPHGFYAIDELARALGVTATFHGHHHDRLNYCDQWPQLGFEAHGVGFCGITDLYGAIIRAGDFDEERAKRNASRQIGPIRGP